MRLQHRMLRIDLRKTILNSTSYSIVTKINARAKRISIKIKSHEIVELVVPSEKLVKTAMKFFETKRIWVENNLSKISHLVKVYKVEPGNEIPVWGYNKALKLEKADRAFLTDDELIIPNNFNQLIKLEVRQFLKKELSAYLRLRVVQLASVMNLHFYNITIKDTKSKWGSCSIDGELSFAFRLVFLPKEVVDYVIVHELAHLKHMNHSQEFWGLVEKHCSNFKQLRNALKRAPQVEI